MPTQWKKFDKEKDELKTGTSVRLGGLIGKIESHFSPFPIDSPVAVRWHSGFRSDLVLTDFPDLEIKVNLRINKETAEAIRAKVRDTIAQELPQNIYSPRTNMEQLMDWLDSITDDNEE